MTSHDDLVKLDEERMKLVNNNLFMLDRGAKRYAHKFLVNYDELYQEGYFGLHRSAQVYDYARPYEPYAYRCITNAMRDYIRHERIHLDRYVPLEYAENEAKEDSDIDSIFSSSVMECLTDWEKELLLIRYIEDVKIDAMAKEYYNVSIGTMHTWLKDTEKKIKNKLKKNTSQNVLYSRGV
jgi:RNA polymerase sigma factor (sigma-70 family)